MCPRLSSHTSSDFSLLLMKIAGGSRSSRIAIPELDLPSAADQADCAATEADCRAAFARWLSSTHTFALTGEM